MYKHFYQKSKIYERKKGFTPHSPKSKTYNPMNIKSHGQTLGTRHMHQLPFIFFIHYLLLLLLFLTPCTCDILRIKTIFFSFPTLLYRDKIEIDWLFLLSKSFNFLSCDVNTSDFFI